MKQQVTDMYDQITMPEETAERIRQAMAEKGAQPRRTYASRRPATVAAAFLTVVLLTCTALNTQVRAAVNDFLKRYVFNGGLTVVQQLEDGMGIISKGSSLHLYAENRDGRLYFIANGENTDITDLTSLDAPYIHTYTDAEGVEHLVIVGGTPENFGFHEFWRESGAPDSPRAWIGGQGENYLDMETGSVYPWLAKAWEELDIPWPLPSGTE